MPDTYPDSPPDHGWPAGHVKRLDALEAGRRTLALEVAAGAAIGTGLPAYLKPEMLEHVRQLATQYPGAALALGLLVVLSGAKIAPPGSPQARVIWEFWARWIALTPWDRWGGRPKMLGRIVPEPPPPSSPAPAASAPPTPRDPWLYPTALPGPGDPHHRSIDPEETPRL